MSRSARALPAALLALALAGAGCANGAEGAAPGDTAAGATMGDTDNPTVRPELADDADSVLVVGDSLVNGARLFGDLGDRLDAAGFDTLEILAEDGEGPDWAVEEIESRDTVPEVVVIELGTNPDADTDGFADTASRLVGALRERGAQRIAWLTPVHGRDDRYDEKAAILTATPGIDEVADWATVVREDPRRLAADGIHPTQEGYVDLAEFLVSTAAALAS